MSPRHDHLGVLRGLALRLAFGAFIAAASGAAFAAPATSLATPASWHEPAEHATQEPSHGTQEPADHATDEHADPAHADDEHAAEEHHGPTWGELAARWTNFVLLVALLYWLLVDPPAFVRDNFEFNGLRELLTARAAGIVSARDLAAEQTRDAAVRLDESARRLENVESEAAALIAQAREDGARERSRVETDAVTEAGRIRDHADRDLDGEVRRAARSLQAHVADLAVGIATRLVKDNFTGDDQERLVREYLDRLGQTVR